MLSHNFIFNLFEKTFVFDLNYFWLEKYQCDRNQFRCRDGNCIDIRYHCNQKYDCPDFSDEYDCTGISFRFMIYFTFFFPLFIIIYPILIENVPKN